MAASKARRDLCYFTFDDEALRDELYNIHKFLTEKNLTIGKCYIVTEGFLALCNEIIINPDCENGL